MDQRSAYVSDDAFFAAVRAKVQSASGYSVQLLGGDDHSNQRMRVLVFNDMAPAASAHMISFEIGKDTELTDALATKIAEQCVSSAQALVSSGRRLAPVSVAV